MVIAEIGVDMAGFPSANAGRKLTPFQRLKVICWHLLTNDADDDDLGGDYFTRRTNPDRQRDRAIEQ